jgi:hypothetical protein
MLCEHSPTCTLDRVYVGTDRFKLDLGVVVTSLKQRPYDSFPRLSLMSRCGISNYYDSMSFLLRLQVETIVYCMDMDS